MKIHVFNPEHDLALAHNRPRFTAPHAARELRANLGYIPALWAADGDIVVVDDVEFAIKASRRYKKRMADVLFMTMDDLRSLRQNWAISLQVPAVSVWGWDSSVCHQLTDAGIPPDMLPDETRLARIRHLSGRMSAESLLKELRQFPGTIGESKTCHSIESMYRMIDQWHHVVLKAPWSSSGRGVKYVDGALSPSQTGWCQNVWQQQGCIVVERYNNKVMDFGMEFTAHDDGKVSYEGLSLFQTKNGSYTGNLLATEEEKMRLLAKYLPEALMLEVREQIMRTMSSVLKDTYAGPFGVDMMVVRGDSGKGASASEGFLLNPCVEINLRRTMGHVALALSPSPLEPAQVMRITHDVNYELKCSPLENSFVKLL